MFREAHTSAAHQLKLEIRREAHKKSILLYTAGFDQATCCDDAVERFCVRVLVWLCMQLS